MHDKMNDNTRGQLLQHKSNGVYIPTTEPRTPKWGFLLTFTAFSVTIGIGIPGIEYADFITLKPAHIKEAIPELVPHIKFENMYEHFMESAREVQVLEANDVSKIVENVCTDGVKESSILNFEEPIFDDESFNVGSTSTSVVSIDMLPSCAIPLALTENVKCKIKTVQDIIDIPNIKLKIIITKNVNTMNKNKPLDDFERTVVSKAIVHHLLVNEFYRVIKREEFLYLAKLIVQLFPNELLGTYYIPAVKSQPAQGKLFCAYQNYKTDLREAALIPKRSKALTTPDEKPIQLAEKTEAFKIILEEIENFDVIVRSWKVCYEERQHLLAELSIFEYIRKFPAFSLARGYELLTLDADKILETKTSQLAFVAPKILLYASRKKRNCAEIKDYLAAYNELSVNVDTVETLQLMTALRLLPLLMPLGKKKLNRVTVGQLFCPYFKTESAADNYNIEFKEDHKESTLVLKPRLYFFGELSNPSAHIYLADQKYHIANCLVAFDTLFKCFLGLNCSYPDETLHVWQFIQSEVYGIEVVNGKQTATVLTFIQDIRNTVAD